MIPVTKAFLPPIEEYTKYLKGIWESGWLTNYGPLVNDLEKKLCDYLDVGSLSFCTNGTIAIQLAMKALDISGEVITTPFSYVATTNSILWEHCKPVFVDINENDFCINTDKIEEKITDDTKAILAVHVYGFPCNVEAIEKIAKKHGLKVIYDGAHAFGVQYQGKSLLAYGDITTCSFHATKLFHTVEGGAIISSSKEIYKKVKLHQTFGHSEDDYFCLGINGKNSEFHAAMGLCNITKVKAIIDRRKIISEIYNQTLNFGRKLSRPSSTLDFDYNYAYYPVAFDTEKRMLEVKELLKKNEINTRRYFYPSLNTLPFIDYQPCPVSESVSLRVLALPLFYELAEQDVKKISNLINSCLEHE
ncbi:MAG: DegT/DnrJ/EryC1/StrS family aminotransferase [Bacteroidetes bacterium]|nr:DegT/DnrJ/EryC1/StrS family aminotransferase [Bacteroidota bacterium]